MTDTLRQRSGRLPDDVTSFIGRRQARADVRRLLAGARLVTLTGAAGVGKSRLALRVARDVQRAFPDGVWLVELAKLDDDSLVDSAVVAALELSDSSGRAPIDVLVDYLAEKRLLVVLDNCEHLLGTCARLICRLLPKAPGLRVLATSREALAIGGEQVWLVPPLSVPELESLRSGTAHQYEALTLFEDRASSVLPGFRLSLENETAVARLCRRLDGLPLAIELAAVWLRALSVEQILARLQDRYGLLTTGDRTVEARHRTLRAAVEWSFDLCSELERTLWGRFSVFPGEFDLDAAEAVCAGDGLTVADVLIGVAGLVDKSILVRGDDESRARYRMLETIRQYGAERLTAAGEDSRLRRRHRDYFLALAERSDEQSCGPRQAEWAGVLRAERASMWAALDYCLTEPGEARTGLRLCNTLWFYWVGCGFVRDGRHWMDRALAIDTEPSRERGRALWINGWMAFLEGDNPLSLVLLNEARDLTARLGDETELTYAIQYLAEAEMFVDNMAVAVPMLDEALARHRAANTWTAPALLIFGQRARPAVLSGDVEYAVTLLNECVRICESLGERWTESWAEWNLGVAWWAAGDLGAAVTHLCSALRSKRELNDQLGIPFCIDVMAWAADDPRRAAVLSGAADMGWKLIGRPLFGFETLLEWREQSRARSRESLGEQAYETAYQRGTRLHLDDVMSYGLREKAEPSPVTPGAPGSPWPKSASKGSVPCQALTKREREVAAMVAQGMSNREIATRLVIAQRTVEGHVEHILSKLGFSSRTQIAAWIAEQGHE